MSRRRITYPEPRWQTPVPDGWTGSWGPDVERWAADNLGLRLDRWQRRALNRALLYGPDGRLLHRHYLVSTGRQNGKTVLVRSLIGWALTAAHTPPWALVLGLAHDRPQARIPYEAVMADLAPIARRNGRAGGLRITRYLGIRSSMHGRRREYRVGSRDAANAIRGLSVDLGVFDEVRTQIDDTVWAALEPTTTAALDPLIFGISSAGNDRSALLRDWFDRGRRIIDGAEPARGFGMTWYAAPDGADPDDELAIRAANPAIADGRLSLDVVRASLGSLSPATYRMERGNLWADAADEWLPAGLWAQRVARPPAMPHDGRVTFGLDVVPTWRRATVSVALGAPDSTYVAVAGERVAGRAPVDQSPAVAPEHLVALLDELADAWRPSLVVVSSTSAAVPYVESWGLRSGVKTHAMTAREVRHASELFRGELVGHRLGHADDPLLAKQARDARPSADIEGGDWYLSIKNAAGDVDALRACAWAAWAAIAPPDPEAPVGIYV